MKGEIAEQGERTMELKSIKLNQKNFDRIIEVKEKLVLKGVDSLPVEYRKQILQEIQNESGRFTNGSIVGVAVEMLLNNLEN